MNHLPQQSGCSIPDEKWSALEKFTTLFLVKNEVINLAKIHSRHEFWLKHILDSVMTDPFLDLRPGMKAADLGTGGGLPGIPLAILHPETQFTLIDSVHKKLDCVQEFARDLGLKNITVLPERLEILGRDPKFRESFDVVISRALAGLNSLLELALPMTKVGGLFAAMKGPGYLEEINDADNAMKQLNIRPPCAEKYELPEGAGNRYLLLFHKSRPTPRTYPRRVGLPHRNPL